MSEFAVILLVEDSEDDVFLIRKAFERAGVDNPLHVVRDGEEAISYLNGSGAYTNRAEHPMPQLILLDLKLPRIGGLEVLTWIRSLPGLRGIAVVVLTCTEEMREVNRAYALGANSFLVKPSDFRDYTALAKMLHLYWLEMVKVAESFRPDEQSESEKERSSRG